MWAMPLAGMSGMKTAVMTAKRLELRTVDRLEVNLAGRMECLKVGVSVDPMASWKAVLWEFCLAVNSAEMKVMMKADKSAG